MKLIVGLGNPGDRFMNTRHNVGFVAAEMVAEKLQLGNFSMQKKFEAEVCGNSDFMVMKPQTYMNESGRSVRKVVDYYGVEVEDVFLIHDDLDIQMGEYKLQKGKGPKIHNGVNSVEVALGAVGFWRLRMGVDSRTVEQRRYWEGHDYVLMKLNVQEKDLMGKTVQRAVEELIKRVSE